ncbi:GCG_CRPN prefix-to-repeats domain-containing protein [Lichenihabitans sp. Uapishka_5]|uniref:GCG_CRPN prefix-to-repeats domain-containing protein n=1 Tax=Lichenihabitans sp. Uapishka_5 TaxID=3037302 RepID=UPI003FA5C34E
MRVLCLAVAALAVVSVGLPAQAVPLRAVPGADGGLTLASDGCGPFGHRSHYGYCKDNENPDYAYVPHPYHGGGYSYGPGPGFYEDGGYRPRHCFIRETYDGPVRICR